MGFVRASKRLFRKWKFVVYVLAGVLLVQVLIALNTNPSLLEEEQLRRIKEIQLLKQHQAANALLQGERPLANIRHSPDQDVLNPKDPRFRELFLQHAGDAIGVIEDGNLQNRDWNHVIPSSNILNGVEVEPTVDINFKYQPKCEISLKDSQSAITRAKSAQCKQQIADTACKMQDKTLFPVSMPRTCPHPQKFTFEAPMPSVFDEDLSPVRICYMLVVHGRSFRQFRRLLRVIYHRDHYYYIHVDKRSDYLYREIIKETRQYSNVKVAHWRMATIWGGSSLLQMLLRALSDVTFLWKNWDFFVNLSALDFPIEKDEKLRNFLSTYRSKNFMKSHGREDEKFIRKQGLNRVFVECDQHMWRLGERELPKGITVNGGSDWFALNREFCTYAIKGKDQLLKDLKYWYKYTLLPAESFFHTLAQNSDKCETFVDNNLRVTNWNRARGCKCQYKHIVDWCGCSPNDFYPSDLVRLQTSRPVFFARKFEEIVNQEVVNHLDFKLYGEYPSGTPGLTSYWENYYDHLDGPTSVSDAHLTHYTSFARLGMNELNDQLGYYDNDDEECGLKVDEIHQVEVYKRSEEFAGYLVTLGASWKGGSSYSNQSDVSMQILVSHQPTFRVLDHQSLFASRIKTAMVGTNWDVKELLLRDFGGIIGPNSDPRLMARWKKGSEDFVVTVVVIDPLNIVADYNDFRTPSKASGVTDTPLNLRKPMRPGRWVVRFYVQRQYNIICAEVEFYVTPLQFEKGVEGAKQLSIDNRGVEADGQVNSASRSLYTLRTTLNLDKNIEAFQNLVSNSIHTTGHKLKSWIDSVVERTWRTKDICFASKSSDLWRSRQPDRCVRQRQITPNLCVNMNWSSFSPDPKSELGPVKPNGRLR